MKDLSTIISGMKTDQPDQERLDLVLTDFRGYAERFLREEEVSPAFITALQAGTEMKMWGDGACYPNGLVWFGGKENTDQLRNQPMGHPGEYLKMRDDTEATGEFIGKLLDRGKLYYGTSHWNQDGETATSEYVVWLYRHCEYEPFKRNVEKSVITLLEAELERSFPDPDYREWRKRVKQQRRLQARRRKEYAPAESSDLDHYASLFSSDNLNSAVWRAGLSNPARAEDKAMAAEFKEEMAKTMRWITHGIRYQAVNFTTASAEFRQRFDAWHQENEARQNAEQEWSKRMNRVIGLLEVVGQVGKPDNAFNRLYSQLEEKARGRWMYYAPNVQTDYFSSTTNLYNLLLTALSAIQSDGRLEDFWQTQIKEDTNVTGALTAIGGYLNALSIQGRESLVCPVLQAVQERKKNPPHDPQREATERSDKSNLNFVGRYLSFSRILNTLDWTYSFDPNKLIFDALETVVEEEDRTFVLGFRSATARAEKKNSVRYSPLTDEYRGIHRLEKVTKRYIAGLERRKEGEQKQQARGVQNSEEDDQ